MLERPRRVVLLIDYDNLQICAARDTPGRDLQLPPVVQLAQRYGTVIMARAYAEWNLSTERLAVYKAGIEPAFAPVLRTESDRSGKSLADTVMVAEGMDMLWTLSPDVVVLATSDKDLIPLVRVAKQRGAFVVVLGSDFTAIPLREMADEHVTYRQLVTDASGRFTTEAGPGRQPAALPEPARRRSVRDRTGSGDRPGRERVGASPSGTGAPIPAPARTDREAGRPEREPVVATPSAPLTASPPSGEPVPSVTAGLAGDLDSQAGGRRRRRRGSRRRSDRLGVGSDGLPFGDGEGGPPDGAGGTIQLSEITPTTSAAEVGLSTSSTVEEPQVVPAPAPDAVDAVAAMGATDTPPAPRNRRRAARRPTSVEAVPQPTAESAAGAAEMPTPPLSASEPEADITTASGKSGSTNGAAPTDEAAAAPRARPRRVASAARGRSRRS
ncbi:MAG: NYN domain-containing protein [Chloroflexi bacterium]|nr:NYN domain-containing protein [Chloroflexota bacterium]